MHGVVTSRILILTVLVFAVFAATLSTSHRSARATSKGLFARATSNDSDLPNYDIRTDKSAYEARAAYRNAAGVGERDIQSARNMFRYGEEILRESVPTLKVEYNKDLQIPEVIAPDVLRGRAFLTRPSIESRVKILRDFLIDNSSLIGVSRNEISQLKAVADYTNPNGDLSFVEFNQEINGITVFRGELKAGFARSGEIVRVVNNLAPHISKENAPTDFGDEHRALALGAESTNSAKQAEAVKIYFPIEPGVIVAAWRVTISNHANAFYVIVDANTENLLWRKNLTEDQTQAATYGVYANPNAMINVADNPFPLTPGPTSPNSVQGTAISRTGITRIGNEPPYQFNNLGWITDGVTKTDGNAIQAGLDRDGTDGVDPNSEAVSPTRNFSYSYTPFNPNTNSGDEPVPVSQTYPGTQYQQGTITQLFYISNWFHDELYRLGFTEQAKNFQHDNFGRGGLGGDRVRGEGQDSLGFNNANFSTFEDGTRPRMQMYLWSGPTPDIDGNLDAEVVIHEYAHGLSNRLHGNASGLTMNMSRGLGEGWSDFYAHAMLSEPSDPINGIYTIGGYDTYRGQLNYTNNYYYGIRRFPKAIMSSVGANNQPHNPLTFADADQTQLDLSNGAFPRGPYGSENADAVHNLGEIWSSALWEVRARMINRLGWAAGNRKALQLVMDGMKLAPLAPTFITERDAIIAAAQASSTPTEAAADVADVWAGFAIRGIGASASVQANGTGVGDTRVTQSFDLPNLTQIYAITFNDSAGNNNGFPDPGESLLLNIPITNATGSAANNVTLTIAGGNSVGYGTIAGVESQTRAVAYTVPAATTCGGVVTLSLNVTSSLGPVTFSRTFSVGTPITTAAENFDGVSAPQFPAGWSGIGFNGGIPFVTSGTNPDSAPNSAFAADPTTLGGGADLTSPVFPITVSGAVVEFRNRYNTEAAWDGGMLEISIAGGTFQDIVAAGGAFISNGYDSTLGTGTNNPFSGRRAWSGDSLGWKTTRVRLPASAAGQNIQLKWRFGADNNTAPVAGGWNIDGVKIVGDYTCSLGNRPRVDFDGDGRSDLSVFRPSDRNWYLDRSSAGFTAVTFGVATDIPAPGDFDGDGKADISIYRPSEGNWYRFNSSNGTYTVLRFGVAEDIPQAGDFDADGRDDIAIWRPSTGVWYWLRSSDGGLGVVGFGVSTDKPVADDYDGDGRDDIAVWRPATGVWYFLLSASGYQFSAIGWGVSSDKPVPADFDGDGKTDIAVYRPSEGVWYQMSSLTGGFAAIRFGISTDEPVPGDYDGDGRYDQAVFRSGIWYLNRSSAGFVAAGFGLQGDLPIPGKYIP